MSESHDIEQIALAFIDRKYVSRADARQKAMGLAYVEAERRDLAKEIARLAAPLIASAREEGAKIPEGYVLVPKVALLWLNGEGPDADGKWFGECEADGIGTGRYKRAYWWRSKFRQMIEAASLPSTEERT